MALLAFSASSLDCLSSVSMRLNAVMSLMAARHTRLPSSPRVRAASIRTQTSVSSRRMSLSSKVWGWPVSKSFLEAR